MTKHQPTPSDAAFAAIDIAKYRNEVLIEAPRQRRRRLTVLNTREEHDRLVAALSAVGEPVVVGFEATGNYHRPLAWRLIEAGFEVRLVSSVALARTREALHNGWDKNDPKDAQKAGEPAGHAGHSASGVRGLTSFPQRPFPESACPSSDRLPPA